MKGYYEPPNRVDYVAKRILVPINDSEQAQRALQQALELFAFDEIYILHVINQKAFDYAHAMLPGATISIKGSKKGLGDRRIH